MNNKTVAVVGLGYLGLPQVSVSGVYREMAVALFPGNNQLITGYCSFLCAA